MEELIILEFSTSTVHIFNIEREETIDEEYISNLGYNPSDCHWMAGDLEIVQHKGVLK